MAGAALLLSGCFWSQPGYGPEHRRHNPLEEALTIDNVDTLAELWSTELIRPEVGGAATEAIVADGRVYVSRNVAAADGGIWTQALDVETGASLWNRQLVSGHTIIMWPFPTARSGDTLTVGYGGLLSGRCAGGYGRLNPANGSGTITTAGIEMRSPAVTSGSVAVQEIAPTVVTPNGGCTWPTVKVEATDVRTGAMRWGATLGSSSTVPWYTSFMPAVAGNQVFVPLESKLHAFALAGCGRTTCAPSWTIDFGAPIATVAPPVVTNDGQVIVITADGAMVAISAATGVEQWRADLGWTLPGGSGLGRRPGVAAAGDDLYVSVPTTETGSVLMAFPAGGCGASACTPVWTASTPEVMSAPTVAGGVVYVGATGDTAGEVQAYDAAGCGSSTCAPVVTVPVEGAALNVTVASGKVFVTGTGRVTALAPT